MIHTLEKGGPSIQYKMPSGRLCFSPCTAAFASMIHIKFSSLPAAAEPH